MATTGADCMAGRIMDAAPTHAASRTDPAMPIAVSPAAASAAAITFMEGPGFAAAGAASMAAVGPMALKGPVAVEDSMVVAGMVAATANRDVA